MSITEVPGLVCKDQKTQFPQKNRLSNLCMGQANYSPHSHAIQTWWWNCETCPSRSEGFMKVWEIRPGDFHICFKAMTPTFWGLSGVSSERHRCSVWKAMPPVPWICCFPRNTPAAVDAGPPGRRKPKWGPCSQERGSPRNYRSTAVHTPGSDWEEIPETPHP